MKKWILGAAVCGMALPGYTQTSHVQLYGLLYSGIRWLDNVQGHDHSGLATGPSRWGLRGTEDLGAGLSSSFVLESGFDPSTGTLRQGGRMFGRQAFVGLNSKTLGSLTLGRQYDVSSAWLAPYTPAGKWNGYMSHVGDNDNLNWSYRINNAVKYTSPLMGGFQAAALVSFGEVPGNSSENGTRSLGATWKADGLSVSAAWTRTNTPARGVPDGNWNTILFPSVSGTSPATFNPVTPEKVTIAGVGGDYTRGAFKYALTHTQSTYAKTDVGGMPMGDVKFRNVDVNITWSFSPTLQSGLGYAYTAGKVQASGFKPRYHQLNFMTNYFLSKRTILQAGLIHQRGSGGVENAYIMFSSQNVSDKKRQSMLLLGLFHFF